MTDITLNADPKSVGDLFQKKAIYRVPEYQREFSWSKSQFKDLWKDIQDGIEQDRTHHLNEIKLVPRREMNPVEYQIIDGQQRITTLALLLAAMRDEYDQRGRDQKYIRELHGLLETKDRDANAIRCLRLLNETADDEQFLSVFSRESSSKSTGGNVGKGYRYYREELGKCTDDELDAVRTYTIHNLTLVQTVIENIIQAFIMFETTNARGLELSEVDVVKSLLIRIAHRNGEDRSVVQDEWMEALSHAEAADGSKPKRAIKDVFLVASEYHPGYEFSGRDFAEFMQDVFEEKTDKSVTELLNWLSQHLDEYRQIKNGEVTQFSQRENAHINSLIRQFNVKNPHSGATLYWLVKNVSEPVKVIEALNWASKLSLRLFLADKTAHKKRTAFNKTLKSLRDGTDPKRVFQQRIAEDTPPDRALAIELRTREFKANRATRMVLYRIEVEQFGGAVGGSEYPTAGEDYEVEHIAPMQSFSAKKYTRWRSILDRDEERFNSHRRHLGNLTLLRSRANQEAGTEPFNEKCDKYRVSDFEMSQHVEQTYDSWGFQEIGHRTERMANKAVQAFSTNGHTPKPAIERQTDGGSQIQDYVGADVKND